MKYNVLLFDVDNTLLDFYDAEENAFKVTSKYFGLPYSKENYITYRQINKKWWNLYEKGLCEKIEITTNRFKDYLNFIGKSGNAQDIHNKYVASLSLGKKNMDGAYQVLEYFKNKGCKIYLITNGVSKTQKSRLDGQPFNKFIDGVFISDEIGYPKPKVEYFKKVEELLGVKFDSKTLIVGDSLSSDIQGGINIGVDTALINVDNLTDFSKIKPTYVFSNLYELMTLF